MNGKELELFFQTVNTPAPFSYKYDLLLKPADKGIYADLSMEYTDRDTLTEEEILEEGFTMDDNYNWKGNLSPAWQPFLDELILKLEKGKTNLVENFAVRAIIKSKTEKSVYYFSNTESFEFLLNEILQAVFETSGKERALEVKLLLVDSKTEEYTLTGSFKDRKATVSSSKKNTEMKWDDLRRFLSTLYAPEYLAQHAEEKMPKEKGQYIDPGDGLWYKIGKAVVEPGKKSKTLEKLTDAISLLKG